MRRQRHASAAESELPRLRSIVLARPLRTGFLTTVGVLLAVALGLAVSNLSTVFIYLLFAVFLALAIEPAVKWCSRRGISRPWAIVIVFVGVFIVLGAILGFAIPILVGQIALFATSVPTLIDDFSSSGLFHTLEGIFGPGLEGLLGDLQTFVADPANIAAIGGGALKVGVSVATGISGAIIVLVLTLYFVASLPTIKSSMYQLAPARNRPRLADMTEQITDAIGGYTAGMVTLAFFNAIFTGILYFVLGLPFPPLMMAAAFLLTLIPLVGSVLFWAIGSILALFADPVDALIFAVAYLVYMQLEAYMLTPRVMNRAVSIPGSLVVIGALVGGTLLGLLGALIAVPVTASILLIIKQIWIPQQDARV
ncbi:AI-2E family transporter [Paramicrobacterium chengjingii]|uniref:AI-2E family transporter n=1 Tax=Paramicrobacterium chengjingii TaxID=2769067 RepID=UPI00142025A2|nr:AI-2E family transporter [Microbacterium chengjingii]